jgi:hypothetical protein
MEFLANQRAINRLLIGQVTKIRKKINTTPFPLKE